MSQTTRSISQIDMYINEVDAFLSESRRLSVMCIYNAPRDIPNWLAALEKMQQVHRDFCVCELGKGGHND